MTFKDIDELNEFESYFADVVREAVDLALENYITQEEFYAADSCENGVLELSDSLENWIEDFLDFLKKNWRKFVDEKNLN